MTKSLQRLIALLFLAFTISTQGLAQNKQIIKGASEYRKFLLENDVFEFQKMEKLRRKLDTLGVSNFSYDRFCNNLFYVAKNLTTGELKGRQYIVDALKNDSIYNYLSTKEVAFLLEHKLIRSLFYTKIFSERYPHVLNKESLYLKEIRNYGIQNGDRILIHNNYDMVLPKILSYSFDDLEIVVVPYKSERNKLPYFEKELKGFNLGNSPITLATSMDPNLEAHKEKYDFILSKSIPLYKWVKPTLKKCVPLLNQDGKVVLSFNYDFHYFDRRDNNIAVEPVTETVKELEKYGLYIHDIIEKPREYVIYKLGLGSDR